MVNLVQAAIQANPVMIFSKTTCPYCDKVKDALDCAGIEYYSEEVDKSPQKWNLDELKSTFITLTGLLTLSHQICDEVNVMISFN